MSKKFNKTFKSPTGPTMTEETKAVDQNQTTPAAEEVAFHLRPKHHEEAAATVVPNAPDASAESTEEVSTDANTAASDDPTVPVKEEQPVSQPAVNISAAMPQASDPIEDGSLEKAIEQAPVDPTKAFVPPVQETQASAPVNSDKSEEELYLDKIRESGTIEQKRILAAVETFAEKMKPRVEIEPIKGAAIQVEFLDHLLWILKKDYETFRAAWNVLLVYFSLYHGTNNARNYTALSEFSTTRFLFAWTKGIDKCNCYRNLITLLRATRNKDTRKHDIKTINLAFVGPNVLGEDELNNLKQFYQV